MSNVTDLKALKRRKIRRKAYHALLIITLALSFVYGISKLTNNPNYVGFSSIFELFRNGPGYPLDAPGGKSKGMYENSGNLIIINETTMYMFNANGNEIFNLLHQMMNPKIVTKGSMVLNYDRGSKSYSAYNRSTPFVSTKTNDPIRCADISADGQIVLATQKGISQSIVTVYDKNQKWRVEWKSDSSTVTSVAISDDGKEIAVAAAYVENGVLKSKLTMIKGEKTVGEKVFDDQLILQLYFRGNQIQGISDKTVFLCDETTKLLGQYEFEKKLASFDFHEGGTVLVLGDYEQERRYRIVSLSPDSQTVLGKNLLEENLQQKIKVSGNTILALGSQNLIQYSVIDCSVLGQESAEALYDMQPMGKFAYCMTTSNITRTPILQPSRFSILNKIAQGELEVQQAQEKLDLPRVVAVPGLSKSEEKEEELQENISTTIPSLTVPGEPTIGLSGEDTSAPPTDTPTEKTPGKRLPQTPQKEDTPPADTSSTTPPETTDDGTTGGKRLPQTPQKDDTPPADTSSTTQPETTDDETAGGKRLPQTTPPQEGKPPEDTADNVPPPTNDETTAKRLPQKIEKPQAQDVIKPKNEEDSENLKGSTAKQNTETE